MNIGQKLKKARMDAQLTQEELSEKIKVSRQTISSWENGRSYPDIVSLIMLSDIYSISLDSLLKGDELMIKKLKESTDVVKSTKKLTGIFILWMIGYGTLYLLQHLIAIPKIENMLVNVLVLVIGCAVLFYQLVKNINIKKILDESTSNRKLAKAGIGILYVAAVFIIFPIINFFTDVEWQIMAVRLISCLLLILPCSILFKKI